MSGVSKQMTESRKQSVFCRLSSVSFWHLTPETWNLFFPGTEKKTNNIDKTNPCFVNYLRDTTLIICCKGTKRNTVLPKKSKITTLDILILLTLLGGLAYVIYQVKVKLNYNWQWGIIPQYLFRYDAESGKWVSNYLIHGLMTTLCNWGLHFWPAGKRLDL